MIINEMQK